MARAAQVSDDDLTVLDLLGQGLTTDAIARELGVSERTLRRRVRHICDRLDVKTPIEAVVWAARNRLI